MPLPWPILLFLCASSLVAGAIDAIAGGGGLITLPALLAAGLPPQLALGNNKGQSVFGAAAALIRFWRSGLITKKRAWVLFPAGLAGAFAGAAMLMALDPTILRPLVLVMLIGAAAFVAFRRQNMASIPKPEVVVPWSAGLAMLISFGLGAYDGFFGPGTGTFLIVLFVSVLGLALPNATAEAKVVNFASNLAALILFASRGNVWWAVALPMAACNLTGGWLGAHFAIRGGEKVIRSVLLAVVTALVLKLSWDLAMSLA